MARTQLTLLERPLVLRRLIFGEQPRTSIGAGGLRLSNVRRAPQVGSNLDSTKHIDLKRRGRRATIRAITGAVSSPLFDQRGRPKVERLADGFDRRCQSAVIEEDSVPILENPSSPSLKRHRRPADGCEAELNEQTGAKPISSLSNRAPSLGTNQPRTGIQRDKP